MRDCWREFLKNRERLRAEELLDCKFRILKQYKTKATHLIQCIVNAFPVQSSSKNVKLLAHSSGVPVINDGS